jgi:hypothetical protein
MVYLEYLVEAYYDCRKKKRRTASAIEYEMDYMSRLMRLRDRINDRSYIPGTSICFVVTRPRYREVFAAAFEDRIIHHYVSIRLTPLFEQVFNDRTFNCRKDKGQLYGVKMIKEDIARCSNHYTSDCYVMTLDIKGFFMSIRKDILANMIDDFIIRHYGDNDKEDLRFLCHIIIMHEPEKDCIRKSPDELWKHIPKNKSLFTNGKGRGIAIGNLFAQLFANYYLNEIDWLIEKNGIKFHGRYVDDIYCISEDKNKLLNIVPIIRGQLAKLGLNLNPKKFYLQYYKKGIPFTGAIVKPGRVYAMNRTIENFKKAVFGLNSAKSLYEIEKSVNRINSYLGLLRHYDEYGNRRRILGMINARAFDYIYIKGHFESVSIKNKYKKRFQTIIKIKNGEW